MSGDPLVEGGPVRLLWLAHWRHLCSHPWLAALAVLGVAVGVAGLVAMDLARYSALRSFELTSTALTGRATHQIVGGPAGVPEELYAELRLRQGLRLAAPVVEGLVTARGQTLRVLGVDPFAEDPFRAYLGGGEGPPLQSFLSQPHGVLLSRRTATRLGVRPGDRVPVTGGQELTVVGLLTPGSGLAEEALEGLLLVDVSTAQELLDSLGRLSRIDLILAGPAPRLPAGVELLEASQRKRSLIAMSRAFFLNLQALSLLSLLVSVLLVYNIMSFLVVQRQPLLARLRILGVTGRELGAVVLAEAAALAVTGTLLGEPLGILLGRGLVQLVTRTVDDLYYAVEVTSLAVSPWVLAKGAALALGASLLAAWGPARWAAHTRSRSLLEQQAQRAVSHAFWLGLGCLAASWLALVYLSGLAASLVAMFALMAGLALVTPALVGGLNTLAGRAPGPLTWRLAARSATRNLSRTGVALAALMVAISATVGIGVMVQCFRGSLVRWLEHTLSADVYVGWADRNAARTGRPLPAELVERIVALPHVAGYSLQRSTEAGEVSLSAVQLNERGKGSYRLLEGSWEGFEEGSVLLSEPLAQRLGLGPGDRLRLRTQSGPRDFPVAGVFLDYISDTGYALLALSVLRRDFGDPGVSAIALDVRDGQLEALVEEARRVIGEHPLQVRSNRSIKEISLTIFERTFAVTSVLRLLAVGVAFGGMLSALLALQLERVKEFAILRCLGMTPAEVRGLVRLETTLAGLWCGLLAVPAGLLLAFAMVHFINRRAFGWSLDFEVPWLVLAQAPLLALVSAWLAAWLAARRAGQLDPGAGLREE